MRRGTSSRGAESPGTPSPPLKSPVFEAGKAPTVERGLGAYLAGDGNTAAPILVPQVADPDDLPR